MKTKKEKIYLVLILLVAAAAAGVAIFGLRSGEIPAPVQVTPRPTAEVIIREVEKMVEVEKKISPEIVQSGLRDLGFLTTEEYYFTEIVSFSSIRKLFRTDIDLKFTESSYLASYDGTVTAGVDFGKIGVSMDEEARKITVILPAAEIQNVTIDPESFELHSEKQGLGNPISVEDFNTSLVALENNAREKAIARGLLPKAQENARIVIGNFVNSLLAGEGYTVEYAAG